MRQYLNHCALFNWHLRTYLKGVNGIWLKKAINSQHFQKGEFLNHMNQVKFILASCRMQSSKLFWIRYHLIWLFCWCVYLRLIHWITKNCEQNCLTDEISFWVTFLSHQFHQVSLIDKRGSVSNIPASPGALKRVEVEVDWDASPGSAPEPAQTATVKLKGKGSLDKMMPFNTAV